MKCNSLAANEVVRIGRRTFLTSGLLGGGASLLALTLPAGMARAAGKTEALLLSCMDFRLIDETERYMTSRGLRNKYDHVILAGASLGALTDKYPAWNKTFWEHLDVAIELHQIHKVMVMDHRDCGAYKVVLGEDFSKDRAKETAIHTEKLRELRQQLNAKYPKLEVELLLMSLDGKVEKVVKN
jgi:carbonic anhydrase